MASSNASGAEESRKLAAELGKTLKEGERILGPTRRLDGTLRKPIRIRAGYVPQDEVAIYQSKGALVIELHIIHWFVNILFGVFGVIVFVFFKKSVGLNCVVAVEKGDGI